MRKEGLFAWRRTLGILTALLLVSVITEGMKCAANTVFPQGEIPPPPKILDESKLTPPPSPFVKQEEKDAAIIYLNPVSGNTIFVNATCGQCEELSDVKQLSRNLLFPIDERKLVSEGWETVAGQKTLHRVVGGTFEGARVTVDSYVLTTDPCVFDLVYTARTVQYEQDQEAFEQFVDAFVIQPPAPELGLKPTAACIKRSP